MWKESSYVKSSSVHVDPWSGINEDIAKKRFNRVQKELNDSWANWKVGKSQQFEQVKKELNESWAKWKNKSETPNDVAASSAAKKWIRVGTPKQAAESVAAPPAKGKGKGLPKTVKVVRNNKVVEIPNPSLDYDFDW
jgi:hypothetical protein